MSFTRENVQVVLCEEQENGMMSCSITHGDEHQLEELRDIDMIRMEDVEATSWRTGPGMQDADQLAYYPEQPTTCEARERGGPGSTLNCSSSA